MRTCTRRRRCSSCSRPESRTRSPWSFPSPGTPHTGNNRRFSIVRSSISSASIKAALFLCAAVPLWAAAQNAAQQGYFFTGGKYSNVKGKQVLTGQLYVEFQIPAKRTHPLPIVMIHGLGQSGTNFTGTPDGREG